MHDSTRNVDVSAYCKGLASSSPYMIPNKLIEAHPALQGKLDEADCTINMSYCKLLYFIAPISYCTL